MTAEEAADPVVRATSSLRAVFDEAPPSVVTVAPGRVNLVGGHTDYNDGLCLPMAVDRHVAVAATPRADDRLRVHTADFAETVTVAPGEVPDGWAAYPAAVAAVLREDGPVPGANLAIAGDVPPGAGLSSSAALELAVGRALVELADRDVSTADLAVACWRAEREGVGVECGILDQFAAGLCREHAALYLDCRTRTYDHLPLDADAGVLVVDTGVSRELADSGYNDRVRECREAVASIRGVSDRTVDSLRDVDTDLLERHADALDEVHYRRARHVVTENDRVRRARDALRAGDLRAVGETMTAAHASLRDDYEVSCDELDAAVELATGVDGVFGARMVGGGFGGSAVALVDGAALGRAEREIRASVEGRVGPDARVFACRPSGGVRVVESPGDG